MERMLGYAALLIAGALVACSADERAETTAPSSPPLRPDLFTMDQGELEAYFLAYENTPQRADMDAWLREHNMEMFRDSKGAIITNRGVPTNPYPDAHSMRSIYQWDTNVASEIEHALHRPDDMERSVACITAWQRRGGSTPHNAMWSGIHHIEARDGVGRIVRTEPRSWPEGVDEELQRCALARSEGRTWPASRDYSFRVQTGWWLPGAVGGTALHPNIDEMDHGQLDAYFRRYENTPQQADMEAWLRKHDIEIYRASDGMVGISYGIETLAYDDTDSHRELSRRNIGLAHEIASALNRPTDPKTWGACVAEWRERGGKISKTVRYRAVNHVEAKDRVGRLVRYEIRQWPEGLDEELKRCAVSMYEGRRWNASEDYSFKFEGGGIIPKEEGGSCVVE